MKPSQKHSNVFKLLTVVLAVTIMFSSVPLRVLASNNSKEAINGDSIISDILYGDFTGNGEIDGTDILWINRYIQCDCDLDAMLQKYPSTFTFSEAAADFTNDGIVDENDVLWMSNYIAANCDAEAMIQRFSPEIDFGHLSFYSVPIYEDDPKATLTSILPNTNAPIVFKDPKFKEAVVAALKKPSGSDLYQNDLSGISVLDVSGKGITSMGELSYFKNLSVLDCSNNRLTALDLSKNSLLTRLVCSKNNLYALDVSKNMKLQYLYCYNNNLTTIDVSNNTALMELYCEANNLTMLDVSKTKNITNLRCGSSQLNAVYFARGNNTCAISVNGAGYLSALSIDFSNGQIQVGATGENAPNWELMGTKIASTLGSINLNLTDSGMAYAGVNGKRLIVNFSATPEAPIVFQDQNFKEAVIDNLKQLPGYSDYTNDSDLYPEDLEKITHLYVNSKEITSMSELSYFINLDTLFCEDNNLTTLNVSNNLALIQLNCDYNNLTTLDVSNNSELRFLNCSANNLTILDLSNNTALGALYCYSTNLTTLDLSSNPKLYWLTCGDNNLTTLDVSNNTALYYFNCSKSNLTTLDVSNNTVLEFFSCGDNNLTTLDVSNNTALQELWCYNNNLTTLDLSNNTALVTLVCDNNSLTTLAIGNSTVLRELYCQNNKLTTLDLGKYTALETIFCDNNNLIMLVIGNSTALQTLYCNNNNLSTLDLGNNVALLHLECAHNNLTTLNLNSYTALWYLDCSYNNLITLNLNSDTALSYLDCSYNILTALDLCSNTALWYLDCSYNDLAILDVDRNIALWYLSCSSNNLATLEVSYNTGLIVIRCWSNNLTSLDLSNNNALKTLYCYYNNLTTLDVSFNTELQYLYCHYNNLTSLDLSNNNALQTLYCYYNNLTTLDVSCNTELQYLYCHYNNLTELDLSNNNALQTLYCYNNDLTRLNASNNTSLTQIRCGSNNLTTLDVSNGTALQRLECDNNNLATLDLSSNTGLTYLRCGGLQLDSIYFTRGSNVCSVEINGDGYFYDLSIDFVNGQIYAQVSGKNVLFWELSGTTVSPSPVGIINLHLTDNGMAYSGVNGTKLVANFSIMPVTPHEKLAMVIGYDSFAFVRDGRVVTIYIATIINLNGAVHEILTTSEMYDANARIGVVSFVSMDNSGRYTFSAPISDPTFIVDNGITKVETGVSSLHGGTSVNLANDSTKFIRVNFTDNPYNYYDRIPDGTVTIYTGISSVPAFEPLSNTWAVSYDVDGIADNIADVVFIFDDVCPACEYSFVYIVGSWNLTITGYSMDVIVEGKWDTVTVRSVADRDILVAMKGKLWNNIKVTSSGILDLSTTVELFHDTNAPQPLPSAGSSIKCDDGFLYLDGVYRGYTAEDDVPVYIITKIGAYEAYVFQVTAGNLDEDDFVFAYLDADSNQVVSAIYIVKDEFERVITSYAPVNVYTSVETAPELPAEITAYYSDGSSGNVSVTWDYIDPAQYASVGTFTVQGTVVGTSIRPIAAVTVSSTPPVAFQDPDFKEAVVDNLKLLPGYSDYTKDSDLYPEDLANITSLDVIGRGITSMGELSYFTNLVDLYCGDNNLSTLDVSNNSALRILECTYNNLAELDVSKNTLLQLLYCGGNNLTTLDVSNSTALQHLFCEYNNLTTLDLSSSTLLQYLSCEHNNLTTLDVSKNTDLQFILCNNNNLTALDLSINTALGVLDCSYNRLTTLDSSNNKALQILYCYNNNLTKLDVSKNLSLWNLECGGAQLDSVYFTRGINACSIETIGAGYFSELTIDFIDKQILVGISGDSVSSWELSGATVATSVDTINLSLSDNGMVYSEVYGTQLVANFTPAPTPPVTFEDPYFKEAVVDSLKQLPGYSDYTKDSDLYPEDLEKITYLSLSNRGITSMGELSYFTRLERLYCPNNSLTKLEVSNNTALQTLYCYNNNLTALDVTNNTRLQYLNCYNNNLTTLDVSSNTALQDLSCDDNNITALYLSNNTALQFLNCGYNDLTALDVTNNTQLQYLYCYNNNLTTLDVSKNTALQYLGCDNNNITALYLSNNTALQFLDCTNNNLETLDLSNNAALQYLYCSGNNPSTLDLSNNIALRYVEYWGESQLDSVYFTRGSNTCSIEINGNSYIDTLVIDFSEGNIIVLVSGEISPSWELSGTTLYTIFSGRVLFLDLTDDGMFYFYSEVYGTRLVVNFPTTPSPPVTFADSAFKAAVVDNLKLLPGYSNYTKDSDLYPEDLANITSLDVSSKGITSMGELSYFTNLSVLLCFDNNLTTLDVSKNAQLCILDCYKNHLTSLDVGYNTQLQYLYCEQNNLTTLDLRNNTQLRDVLCYSNDLTSLDLSNNTALQYLDCYNNKLTTLDVSSNTELQYLYCEYNNLAALDVGNNAALRRLYCQYNNLTSLDVSNSAALEILYCYYNKLISLVIGDSMELVELDCWNNKLTTLDVRNNMGLRYLQCVYNNLTTLDVSNNAALRYLGCYNNNLTALDLSNNRALEYLGCHNNNLTTVDVSNNTSLTNLICGGSELNSVYFTRGIGACSLEITGNGYFSYITIDFVNGQIQVVASGENVPSWELLGATIASSASMINLNLTNNGMAFSENSGTKLVANFRAPTKTITNTEQIQHLERKRGI